MKINLANERNEAAECLKSWDELKVVCLERKEGRKE